MRDQAYHYMHLSKRGVAAAVPVSKRTVRKLPTAESLHLRSVSKQYNKELYLVRTKQSWKLGAKGRLRRFVKRPFTTTVHWLSGHIVERARTMANQTPKQSTPLFRSYRILHSSKVYLVSNDMFFYI
mmetsp:Transcript_5294/g.8187  ORF Transcript_5294/g.8187 Transcript_5294/m.8187 type:complete len:127 (+) Transcript_5294:288-668(+)